MEALHTDDTPADGYGTDWLLFKIRELLDDLAAWTGSREQAERLVREEVFETEKVQ